MHSRHVEIKLLKTKDKADDVIAYVENPKESTEKTPRTKQ